MSDRFGGAIYFRKACNIGEQGHSYGRNNDFELTHAVHRDRLVNILIRKYMNPDTYKKSFTCYMQGYYVIGLLRPFYTFYTSHLILVIDKTFVSM